MTEDLDTYLAGKITEAEFALGAGYTSKLFMILRDAADLAALKHEQTKGLLSPEALADQGRREALGREAAARANQGMQLEVAGRQGRKDLSACMRGAHSIGLARDNNGHATCTQCGTTIVAPDQGGGYNVSIPAIGDL